MKLQKMEKSNTIEDRENILEVEPAIMLSAD